MNCQGQVEERQWSSKSLKVNLPFMQCLPMTTVDKLDKACEQSIRTTSWRWSASSHSESGKGSWNVGGVGGILCMIRKSKQSYSPHPRVAPNHQLPFLGLDDWMRQFYGAPSESAFSMARGLELYGVTILSPNGLNLGPSCFNGDT